MVIKSKVGAAFGGGAAIATSVAFLKKARPVLRLANPPTLSATSTSAPFPPTFRYSDTRCHPVVPRISGDMMLSSITEIEAPSSLVPTFSVRMSALSSYQPGPSDSGCIHRPSLACRLSTSNSPAPLDDGCQWQTKASGLLIHASVRHSSG